MRPITTTRLAESEPFRLPDLVLMETLAEMILMGPDEEELYNQFGPYWRFAVVGLAFDE